MPFLPPNQQRQSTEGILCQVTSKKTTEETEKLATFIS